MLSHRVLDAVLHSEESSPFDLSSNGKVEGVLWGQFNKNSVYKVWAGDGEMRGMELSDKVVVSF